MSEYILKVDNVTKEFNDIKNSFRLQNISFDISEGEIISVIGLNGAGKTTLMKLLLSIIRPTSGKIVFNDTDSIKIGYLPENFSLNNISMTVISLIKFIANLTEFDQSLKESNISKIMDLFSLNLIAEKKTNSLSKGTLKRLGIAQSMIGEPKLIILDEPTDGLDPEWRFKVKEILTQKKQNGTSFLISSHLLFELEQMSDRILIIHNGKQLYFGQLNFDSILQYFNDSNKYKDLEILSSKRKQPTLEELFLNIINKMN